MPLLPPTPLKREDILDRYAQHVKSCPSCSKVHHTAVAAPYWRLALVTVATITHNSGDAGF